MIYHLKNNKGDIETSFESAAKLFENRVLKHNDDGLLLTEYSRANYMELHNASLQRINAWKKLLKKPNL